MSKIVKRKDIGQNFDFCACPRQNVAHCDASGKKAKLLWCKGIFDRVKGNLTEIEPRKHQNVQETPFWQKAPGFDGLKKNLSFTNYRKKLFAKSLNV